MAMTDEGPLDLKQDLGNLAVDVVQLTRRQDRTERMLLIITRDVVDQRSGEAEDELRRLIEELRAEHESVRRSGAYLILDPQ